MAEIAAEVLTERITMAAACAITGKKPRALRTMCIGGQVPGAVKIGGEWTFDEARLRAWIGILEKQQAAKCQSAVQRPRPIASGRTVPFGGGKRSAAKNADGPYEQTIQGLLRNGSKRIASGR